MNHAARIDRLRARFDALGIPVVPVRSLVESHKVAQPRVNPDRRVTTLPNGIKIPRTEFLPLRQNFVPVKVGLAISQNEFSLGFHLIFI